MDENILKEDEKEKILIDIMKEHEESFLKLVIFVINIISVFFVLFLPFILTFKQTKKCLHSLLKVNKKKIHWIT